MPFKKGHQPANKKKLDEQKVLELYQSGLSTNKIGQLLGCHKSLISRLVKKHQALRFRTLTSEERARVVELYNQGLSGPDIAKQLRVCSPAVYLALKKHKVPRRSVSDYDYEEPLRHEFFNVIDTEQKAYWLGMLVTDGCITRNHEIVLSLAGEDRDHVAQWKDTIGSQAKMSLSRRRKTFDGYSWFCKTARITIRSRRLVDSLEKVGVVPAKTGKTIYPLGIPEDLERHFWRGAIDGDGWMSFGRAGNRNQFVIGLTGDRDLIEAFAAFCRKHVPTRATIQPNGRKVVKFVLTDWFAFEIAKLLYSDGTVALQRKRATFLRAVQHFAGRQRIHRHWAQAPETA